MSCGDKQKWIGMGDDGKEFKDRNEQGMEFRDVEGFLWVDVWVLQSTPNIRHPSGPA
jgi:hypothetical protein